MTQENLPGFPWRIDEDNANRIVVKNDRGEIVHQAEYADIPTDRGAAFVEQTIKLERAFAHAMVGLCGDLRSGIHITRPRPAMTKAQMLELADQLRGYADLEVIPPGVKASMIEASHALRLAAQADAGDDIVRRAAGEPVNALSVMTSGEKRTFQAPAQAEIDADWPEREKPIQPQRMPEGYVLVPQAALDWLNGEKPDADGKWFGECEDEATAPGRIFPRKFWWRSKFRELCALSRPECPPTEKTGE